MEWSAGVPADPTSLRACMRCHGLDILAVTAARYVLGAARADALQEAADRALDDGLYSEELSRLANEFDYRSRIADAGAVFERALAQLGLSLPSGADAGWIALRDAVRKIAEGEVSPRAGLEDVRRIHQLADPCPQPGGFIGDSHDLQQLLGARWAYDEVEEEEFAVLDPAVVADAKKWLAQHAA